MRDMARNNRVRAESKVQFWVSKKCRETLRRESERLSDLTGRHYSMGSIVEELVRTHLVPKYEKSKPGVNAGSSFRSEGLAESEEFHLI